MKILTKSFLAASLALAANTAAANTASGNIDGTLTIDAECTFVAIPAVTISGTVSTTSYTETITVDTQCLGTPEDMWIEVSTSTPTLSVGNYDVNLYPTGTTTPYTSSNSAAGVENYSVSFDVVATLKPGATAEAISTTFQFPLALALNFAGF